MRRHDFSGTVLAAALLLGGCVGGHLPQIKPVSTFSEVKVGRSAVSYYDQGKSALADGNPALAIEAFRRDLVQRGPSVSNLNALGIAYGELGRFDVAEQYFKNAFQLDRFAPDTAYNLSRLRYMQGKFDDAQRLADHARSLAQDCKGRQSFLCQAVSEAAGRMSGSASYALTQIVRSASRETAVQRVGRNVWDLRLSKNSGAISALKKHDAESVREMMTTKSAPRPVQPQSERQFEARAMTLDKVVSVGRPPVAQPKSRRIVSKVGVGPFPTSSEARQLPSVAKIAETPHSAERASVVSPQLIQTVGGQTGAVPAAGRLVGVSSVSAPTLRVVNGVGKRHMARRLAAYLRDRGQSVNGLANAKPYSKKRSIIRYRPGCRDAALALAERLPLGVELIEADLARADLELMLGRDFLGFDRSLQSA